MDKRLGALMKQRRYAEATDVARQLLEKSRCVLGPEHLDTLSVMYYLGAVLHARGKFKDAEQNFRQLLPLREKVLGLDHRDTIAALDAICEALCGLRKYEESMKILDEELRRCERAFGLKHELTIKTLRNMGNVYRIQGQPHLASSVLLRALELSERLFGREHSNTSGIRGDLSEVRGPPDSLALRQALAFKHGLPIPGDPLAGIKTMNASQQDVRPKNTPTADVQPAVETNPSKRTTTTAPGVPAPVGVAQAKTENPSKNEGPLQDENKEPSTAAANRSITPIIPPVRETAYPTPYQLEQKEKPPDRGILCQRCNEFLHWLQAPNRAKENVWNGRYRHYRSAQIWQSGLDEGCSLCTFLDSFCKPIIKEVLSEKRQPLLVWFADARGVEGSESMLANVTTEDEPFHGRKGLTFRFIPVPPEQMDLARYKASDTVSSAIWLPLARLWLNNCIRNHTKCERARIKGRERWKPTRLIHINEFDNSMRLVEGDDIPFPVTYGTLSHCWGQIPGKLVLKAANMKELKKKIPQFDKLKTFQDAVDIARQLGLGYLWIDSLCIIQDSEDDWRHEASLMSEVYKYALFNISATAAADDTQGCFSMRIPMPGWTPPQSHLRFEFKPDPPIDQPTEGVTHLLVPTRIESPKALNGIYDLVAEDIFRGWIWDVTGGAVNKRGWVLQERYLAPRILHFGWTQLYWECAELQASGMFPFGFPDFKDYKEDPFKALSPFNLHVSSAQDSPGSTAPSAPPMRKAALEVWSDIVKSYAAANLTFEKDRLVAISSLARELKPFIQGRYLAGHWEPDLILQLAWDYKSGADYGSSRPYSAPSWSWASINTSDPKLNEIYKKAAHQSLAETLEAQIDLASDDEMGQVKSGYLRIRGQIFEIRNEHGTILLGGKTKTGLHMSVSGDTTNPLTRRPQNFYCLPVYATYDINFQVHSIVLQRVDRAATFRRVGVIKYVWNWKWNPKPELDPLVRAMGELMFDSSGAPIRIRQNGRKVTEGEII